MNEYSNIRKPMISAVICTHNRFRLLDKCLASLMCQTLDQSQYEVIVINNRSTDDTDKIIRKYEREACLRPIYEPEIGLSIARNTGWRNARGQFIGFIDDDAVASEKWLETALACFLELKPTPAGLTGPIRLDWESARPVWINEELKVPLGKLDWGSKAFKMEKGHYIIGANCFFSKQYLHRFNGFDQRLGRKKDLLLSGEETQLQNSIQTAGGVFYYHPGINVDHFVPRERTEPKWFYKRYFWGGRTDFIISKISDFDNYLGIPHRDRDISSDNDHKMNRVSQIKRLLKNAIYALGIGASKKRIVQGRIYMSYVVGWAAEMFGRMRRN